MAFYAVHEPSCHFKFIKNFKVYKYKFAYKLPTNEDHIVSVLESNPIHFIVTDADGNLINKGVTLTPELHEKLDEEVDVEFNNQRYYEQEDRETIYDRLFDYNYSHPVTFKKLYKTKDKAIKSVKEKICESLDNGIRYAQLNLNRCLDNLKETNNLMFECETKLKDEKLGELKVDDLLHKYVSFKGILAYKVLSIEQHDHFRIIVTECQACNHHDRCVVKIAENTAGQKWFLSCDNKEHYLWHADERQFYHSLLKLKKSLYQETIDYHRRSIDRYKEEISGYETSLAFWSNI